MIFLIEKKNKHWIYPFPVICDPTLASLFVLICEVDHLGIIYFIICCVSVTVTNVSSGNYSLKYPTTLCFYFTFSISSISILNYFTQTLREYMDV